MFIHPTKVEIHAILFLLTSAKVMLIKKSGWMAEGLGGGIRRAPGKIGTSFITVPEIGELTHAASLK